MVTDRDGRFVTDLEAKDFEIPEDGKLVSVLREGREVVALLPRAE